VTISPKAVAAGFAALAALAIPASASADTASETSTVAALKKPAMLDGKRYSAKQMKRQFGDQQLFFVLGSREESDGAVAAFRTRSEVRDYLERTDRQVRPKKARATYNGYESVFYEHPFLEGASITVPSNSTVGNLADRCMYWTLWWCNTSWDNAISSAKTGYNGAYLYNRPWHDTTQGYVYLPGYDSVEVHRFFNDLASSIWVP
jgi:hypothetical protein